MDLLEYTLILGPRIEALNYEKATSHELQSISHIQLLDMGSYQGMYKGYTTLPAGHLCHF